MKVLACVQEILTRTGNKIYALEDLTVNFNIEEELGEDPTIGYEKALPNEDPL